VTAAPPRGSPDAHHNRQGPSARAVVASLQHELVRPEVPGGDDTAPAIVPCLAPLSVAALLAELLLLDRGGHYRPSPRLPLGL
jgi:hypothetical protein